MSEIREVPISEIVEVGDNVRRELGDVTELATSIKQLGILVPLVVSPSPRGLLLVAGHRRLAAARRAKLRTVPVMEREIPDDKRIDAMFAENAHRRELSILEKAETFRFLMERDGLSQQGVADRLGITQVTVSRYLQFFKLPVSVQADVLDGRIGLQKALSINVRKAKLSGMGFTPSEVSGRVFVVVATDRDRRVHSVQVFTDRERAFDTRDTLMLQHHVRIYPCEVDASEQGAA